MVKQCILLLALVAPHDLVTVRSDSLQPTLEIKLEILKNWPHLASAVSKHVVLSPWMILAAAYILAERTRA